MVIDQLRQLYQAQPFRPFTMRARWPTRLSAPSRRRPVTPQIGIGKALVSRCLRALAKANIRKCNIFLFRSNAGGRSFWQHNAWNFRRDLSVLQKPTL